MHVRVHGWTVLIEGPLNIDRGMRDSRTRLVPLLSHFERLLKHLNYYEFYEPPIYSTKFKFWLFCSNVHFQV